MDKLKSWTTRNAADLFTNTSGSESESGEEAEVRTIRSKEGTNYSTKDGSGTSQMVGGKFLLI